jgi:hypothetical protein
VTDRHPDGHDAERLPVGARVIFDQRGGLDWTVRAASSSGRWTLLSAPSGEKQWSTAYTVIDWATRQRGSIDIIGGGIGLRSQSGDDPVITDTLAGLEAGEWELSHRHRIPLSAYVVEDG